MKKPTVGETDKLRALTEDPEGRALMERYDAASPDERERLHPDLIRAIREKFPGFLEEYELAFRNGDYLKAMFDQCMERVLARPDLSAGRKTNAQEDADAFVFVFTELQREDLGAKEMKELAYELSTRALFTALRAGLSPEEVEKIELHAEIGRRVVSGGKRGGTKSGRTRSRENKPWAPHATELAQVIYADLPGASDEDIAFEIKTRWKLEEVSPPTVRTLVTFVSELRERGKLPKRTQ
jgi:hypothetical protein